MKRLTTIVLTAALLLTLVTPAAAREDARLTEAIRLVKNFFPSTNNYKVFYTSQDSYEGKTVFHLHWSESKEDPSGYNPSRLSVRVDAQRSLIVGYNFEAALPRTVGEGYVALPALSQKQCEDIALQFAGKLAPKQLANMKLERIDKPTIRIGKRHWPHYYTFTYVQHVNGIPFAINSLTVTVNADTGAVHAYNLTWDDYDFPSPEGALSLQAVEQIFNKTGLKLVYQRSYAWNQTSPEPYLAYVLEDGSALQIDAFTGEVSKGGNHFPRGPLTKDMVAGATMERSFTPQELKEIELIASLISAEQAESIARDVMSLSPEVPLRGSRLFEDSFRKKRVWHLDFELYTEGFYTGASAQINAATGDIESFYYGDKLSEEGKPDLTYDEAKAVALAFLEKWAPKKLARVELVSDYKHDTGDVLPHSYGFTFRRLENNIPVLSDSLYLNVRYDRKVTNYGSSWYEGEFKSPTGALSKERMNDLFLKSTGLKLQYVLDSASAVSARHTRPVVKLVYKPVEMQSYLFDAFTGRNIDYFGKEIVVRERAAYTDISGHWAEADIRTLVELELLRLPGDKFRPDEVITLGDLLKALADASGWGEHYVPFPGWLRAYEASAYSSALNFAAQGGLITEKDTVNPDQPVTREVLAYYLARMQGHGDTAKLKGIWTAPYSDFASVAPEYQGSVAISHALGLMGGASGGRFLPKEYTTRAQTAAIIARMLYMK